MKPTKQMPTIKNIEKEFDEFEAKTTSVKILGYYANKRLVLRPAEQIKSFYREEITEMLDWLIEDISELRYEEWKEPIDLVIKKIEQLKEK